jgi:hypothetical protein
MFSCGCQSSTNPNPVFPTTSKQCLMETSRIKISDICLDEICVCSHYILNPNNEKKKCKFME